MSSQPDNASLSALDLFNVDGLVAFITGAGTGIGLMFAKALIKNGAAKVYIAGRRLEVLEKAASSIGPNAIPVQCDVTSKESLREAAKLVEKDSGYLNLLICNSGITGPSAPAVASETTLEEWADGNFARDVNEYVDTFAVNTVAVWYTTMAFLKLLGRGNEKKNVTQQSQVVITSSIAGFNKTSTAGWAYGQSKTAAILASKQLATALPRWNIRANCIAPGIFPSEMTDSVIQQYRGEAGGYGVVPTTMIPMGRLGEEADMAGTILYLASKAGSYCNGVVVVLDGGRLNTFPSIN
ncbi:short chain dehydrogenase family protein [Metarhizium robertsii]|uniref:Short chain dehydrogenase n=2 Tax=Metarhizium robertsii TaxID=568076 RepID=E9EPN8_METRA|nr:short chain dehydrogenase [Metarhizium robertsii ARSEF 23]EFZ02719.2 short chain dehydrogenase [Metarhizium robertsii ARSEF 23]EXV05941.1 short chain dehydrogenase family protein [Metarhizium robertsii]